MDVYADGLVSGLRQVRPDWSIVEITPPFVEYRGSSFSRIKKYYQRYWYFPRRVRQMTDIDVFHIVDHSDGHLLYGLRSAGHRAVVTCHDLINYTQPENLDDQSKLPLVSRGIWQYAVKGICRASHIVTVSNHTAHDVDRLFGITPDRITIAYNGVSPRFRQLPQQQVALLKSRHNINNKICLLNVGSNHPRKNVFAILKSLDQLRQQGLDVCFIKAGADLTTEQKLYVKKRNLTDYVVYVGKPSKETLVDLYNVADILVAPSLYEGFGITLLEAMASGTPVVTSNATSLPEVVGDAGIMVPPEAIEEITAAVRTLANSPDSRKELIDRGLERAKQFTWQSSAETVAQVYETLVAQRPQTAVDSNSLVKGRC